MPLSKDPGVRESEKYCSYCYRNGKFTYEGDLKGFQEISYNGMVQKGMNKYLAKFYAWVVRFAPRWRGQN
jgi:hypothetical protein